MGDELDKDQTVVTVISKLPAAEVTSTGEACLVVISGIDLGKKYALNRSSTLIGRSPKTDIQLDEDSISRNHAMIVNEGSRVIARDLGSTNGTYVNGIRIRQNQVLKDGDLVRLGSMNFGFFTGAEFRRVGEPSAEVLRLISEAAIPPTAPMDDMPETVADESKGLPPNLEQTLHFMSGTEFVQEEERQ